MGIRRSTDPSVPCTIPQTQRISRWTLNIVGVITSGLILWVGTTHAQTKTTPSQDQQWNFEAALYLFASSVTGDAGVRNVDSDVDVGFSEILENLDLGAMAFLGGRNKDWSVLFDGAYLKLRDEESASRGRSSPILTATVEVEIEQIVVEGFLGRKVSGGTVDGHEYRIDLLGGIRYNSITVELDARASVLGLTAAADRERSVDWVDPVVGIRGEIWPTDSVRLLGWFDYGGFGIGADSTWQVFAGVSYHPTSTIDLIAGYRVLAFDYEDGSGNSRIKLDLTYSGPMFGVAYRF